MAGLFDLPKQMPPRGSFGSGLGGNVYRVGGLPDDQLQNMIEGDTSLEGSFQPGEIEPLQITPNMGAMEGGGRAARAVSQPVSGFVVRRPGENVGSANLGTLGKPGNLYRGMTQEEFAATLGAGAGLQSKQRFSVTNEGTSLTDDLATAESYVNFGRDDPRVTGKPTYIVEVAGTEGTVLTRDGYFKASEPIPRERITKVYEMSAAPDGSIVAREVKITGHE